MTFSPVNIVGASVSRPYSSAHAGAALVVTPPRASAAAKAVLDRISRREVMLLLFFVEASSSLPFVAAAASAVLGYAICGVGLTGGIGENASAEPADKRAQSAAAVNTDLRLEVAILKLEKMTWQFSGDVRGGDEGLWPRGRKIRRSHPLKTSPMRKKETSAQVQVRFTMMAFQRARSL